MPTGGAAGSRKPGVRLSGNGVAFACSCPCGVETGVAFAGEKWVFFVRFSVAEVSPVSAVVVEGRAVVMAVSWRVSEALCMRFNPQSRRRVRNNDCCVPEEA